MCNISMHVEIQKHLKCLNHTHFFCAKTSPCLDHGLLIHIYPELSCIFVGLKNFMFHGSRANSIRPISFGNPLLTGPILVPSIWFGIGCTIRKRGHQSQNCQVISCHYLNLQVLGLVHFQATRCARCSQIVINGIILYNPYTNDRK